METTDYFSDAFLLAKKQGKQVIFSSSDVVNMYYMTSKRVHYVQRNKKIRNIQHRHVFPESNKKCFTKQKMFSSHYAKVLPRLILVLFYILEVNMYVLTFLQNQHKSFYNCCQTLYLMYYPM